MSNDKHRTQNNNSNYHDWNKFNEFQFIEIKRANEPKDMFNKLLSTSIDIYENSKCDMKSKLEKKMQYELQLLINKCENDASELGNLWIVINRWNCINGL